MVEQIFGIMMMLVAVGVVCILAYLTTIIIAKKSNGLLKSTSVKVLERTTIGLQTTVTIIQVKNKVYPLINQGKQLIVLEAIDIEEWYQSPKFTLPIEEIGGQSQPNPMESLIKKIRSIVLNSTRRKGNGGNTDEKY